MWKETYFWFIQPTSYLINYDRFFGYFFAGLTVAGLILWVLAWYGKHPVVKKILNRVKNLFITIGVIGLIWFGFRYENTPIFAKRMWPGILGIIGLIWFGFVARYLIFDFAKEKREHDAELLKSKYLPKSKK